MVATFDSSIFHHIFSLDFDKKKKKGDETTTEEMLIDKFGSCRDFPKKKIVAKWFKMDAFVKKWEYLRVLTAL